MEAERLVRNGFYLIDDEMDVFRRRAGEIGISVRGAVGGDWVRAGENFDVEAGGKWL